MVLLEKFNNTRNEQIREEVLKTSPVILFESVTYTYPETTSPALRNVSFSVQRGEVLGITGESGCGKSTVLNLISGFIPKILRGGEIQGSIEVEGEEVRKIPYAGIMQKVGVVLQDPSSQCLGMQTGDAIAFGMENKAIPPGKMAIRTRDLLREFSLSDVEGRSTIRTSGGQMQRAAIASRIAMDREILLLDEPTSALDLEGQKMITDIIQNLKEAGISIIVADADMHFLSGLVDRLILLDQGDLVYEGDPDKVYKDPSLRRVAGLPENNDLNYKEGVHTEPIAEVHGVSFSYGKNIVLHNISLNIKKGSCTAILGHNGSGKTTLGMLMAGLIKPQEGFINVGGKQPGMLPSYEAVKQVGYLFQNPWRMFREQTVRKELMIGPATGKINPDEILASFGLLELADKSPWELSVGKQQHLALAILWAMKPKLLILDEPTNGQTRVDRDNLVNKINFFQQEGGSVVLITHDLHLAAHAATDVKVLEKGRLIRNGSSNEVLKDEEFFQSIKLPLPWRRR